MPRRPRVATGGYAYHVLNRAVGRWKIFRKQEDYEAFEHILAQVHERLPARLLSYCLMPNHWHLVLWPKADGELSEFMRLLTVTHTQRWHYHSAGTGPLYQGRFKSFPIQQDYHLLKTCRYVEGNALAAKSVDRAEAWPWNSAHKRQGKAICTWLLDDALSPTARPGNWMERINTPLSAKEHKQIEHSVTRGCPLGDEDPGAADCRAIVAAKHVAPSRRASQGQYMTMKTPDPFASPMAMKTPDPFASPLATPLTT